MAFFQVRRLVAIWRQGYGRKGGVVGTPPSSDRTAKAVEAGQALMAMCSENPARLETLLTEDGGVVLVELLQEPCSERVTPTPLQHLTQCDNIHSELMSPATQWQFVSAQLLIVIVLARPSSLCWLEQVQSLSVYLSISA